MHSVTRLAFLDQSAKFTASSPSGDGPSGDVCPGSTSYADEDAGAGASSAAISTASMLARA